MSKVEQLIAKARRPPALPNWVRLNHRRQSDTVDSLKRFLLNSPKHSLGKVLKIVADVATLGVSARDAHVAVDKLANPLVRKLGHEILNALLPWMKSENIAGIPAFHDFSVKYPIGRGVYVPVTPTFVLSREGKLIPVFIIPWTTDPFNAFQNGLFAAIITDAILTQEGFENSDTLVIMLPRISGAKTGRYVKSWYINAASKIPQDILHLQLEQFGYAIDELVSIFNEMADRGDL
jgi:hypothetical protein